MRVAAVYDIHGNLPALEAVLEEIERDQVDCIVVGGDVLPGPMPRETIALLLDLSAPVHFIRGNGDREVLALRAGTETAQVPEHFRKAMLWVAQQLRTEDERLLDGWPQTLRMPIPNLGEVLFCHATPHSDSEIFTRLTAEEALVPVFEGLDVCLVVCGHTHMQFDRKIDGLRVVNAGSVGMPFGRPGADWLLLGPRVEFRHTRYDLVKAAEQVRQTGYPLAEEFALRNVLHPPSEEEMLGAFSRAG